MKHAVLTAWFVLALSFAAWGLFGYATVMLGQERDRYRAALEQKGQDDIRSEVQARLRATVRDTEVERALLDSVVNYSIVNAVEAIEGAGRAAGVRSIEISQAYPQALKAKDLSAVAITLQSEGTYASLVRAVSLFETLPLPVSVEQVHFEYQKDSWRLNARLQVILATNAL